MRIIDRYLLRQFLSNFTICFLSLTGLYIVFDAFTNMEEFVRCADREGGLLWLLGTYYLYHSVAFFDRTAPLLTLVAAMFTITWIQRHNEMVALMSAGISRVRVAAPVLWATVVITLFSALNRELVIPRISDELARRPQDLVGDKASDVRNCCDNQTNIWLRGESSYRDHLRITKPDFLLPSTLDVYDKVLTGESAFFKPADAHHPAGYLLHGVTKPRDLAHKASLSLDGHPVIFTPRDNPGWLKPDECFVASEITFDQLCGSDCWLEFASTHQLIAGLRSRANDFGANVRVSTHRRFVQPLLDITLLFLGLPLVLTRESRNVFFAIGLCMVVVAIFTVMVMAFQYLGAISSISPALGAWGPLMLAVPLAVGMSQAMWD
jgi:lipopolysaccharide export system permease protein